VKPGGYVTRVDSICNLEGKSSRYLFVGSGISGNKVNDLKNRMDDDVLNRNPDVVVIFIGVNDVYEKSISGITTDPDKFEKDYFDILKKLKDKNIKAILCTPAVVGEKTDFSNPLDSDLNRYCNIIRDIAKKSNLPLIDLRQKFLEYDKANNPENKEKDILTYDKVHLNAKGNQLVADAMWKAVKEN
jgi:lysophospholipase L1-like esterase